MTQKVTQSQNGKNYAQKRPKCLQLLLQISFKSNKRPLYLKKLSKNKTLQKKPARDEKHRSLSKYFLTSTYLTLSNMRYDKKNALPSLPFNSFNCLT